MKILTDQQVGFYQREEYLHAPGAVSQEALELADNILRDWSEWQIEQWVQGGLLQDTRSDLDFTHRMAHLWLAAGRPSYMRSPRRDLVGRICTRCWSSRRCSIWPKTCWAPMSCRYTVFSMCGPSCRISAGPIRPSTRTRNIIATQKKCTC